MAKTKKIPCRVCGKLFKPCGYCQSHTDSFKWRNFACSRECAEKYISDTIAYRDSSKQCENNNDTINVKQINNVDSITADTDKENVNKRKNTKKNQINNIKSINEEREQID